MPIRSFIVCLLLFFSNWLFENNVSLFFAFIYISQITLSLIIKPKRYNCYYHQFIINIVYKSMLRINPSTPIARKVSFYNSGFPKQALGFLSISLINF